MTAQLDKPVTADDKMGLPIGEMLWWAVQCQRRVLRWPRILETHRSPLIEKYAKKEDEFVAAYHTAIRARAVEVVNYCDGIGIMGVTEQFVRNDPFGIALAVDAHLVKDKPDDAFMDVEVAVDILHAGPWRLFKDWIGFQWFRVQYWLRGKSRTKS